MPLFLPPVELRTAVLTPSPGGGGRLFSVGEEFDPDSLSVFHNGRRLLLVSDLSVLDGEFYPIESGGTGTGFDSVVLVSFQPSNRAVLQASYFPL